MILDRVGGPKIEVFSGLPQGKSGVMSVGPGLVVALVVGWYWEVCYLIPLASMVGAFTLLGASSHYHFRQWMGPLFSTSIPVLRGVESRHWMWHLRLPLPVMRLV